MTMVEHNLGTTVSGSYKTEVIHGDPVFLQLREEWDELWRECPEATEAQTLSFQRLYRKHLAGSERLISVSARDVAGRLAALGVFSIRRDRVTLQRRLGFLGEHDVDYHGMLHREGAPQTVGRDMLVAAVAATGQHVSAFEILNVPEASWTRRAVEAVGQSFQGFVGPTRTRLSERFTIPLPASMDAYWASFSKKTRDRLKGKMRKMQRECSVEFRSTTGDQNVAQVLDDIELVERNRWGNENKFGDKASRNFMRSMITELVRERRGRIFTLYADGRCVAYIVGFVLRGALRIPYLAHDISLPGNHSVGLISNVMAIEQCIRDGFQEYDLTRGSEGYKSLLRAELRHNFSAVFYRNRARERMAAFNQRWVAPLLRSRLMRRLRQLMRG
jgi:CelD/BcsL family acetyltransferase involved in cellulose biosynthesis